MNKARRDQISKAVALLDEAKGIIEAVGEEEQEAFDNLPEGLQAAERGQAMEEAAAGLAEAVEAIDEVMHTVEGFGE